MPITHSSVLFFKVEFYVFIKTRRVVFQFEKLNFYLYEFRYILEYLAERKIRTVIFR